MSIQFIPMTHRNVLKRDNYKCKFCGKDISVNESASCHIVAMSDGGKTEWTNLASSCLECAKKGSNNRTLLTPVFNPNNNYKKEY